MINKKNIQKPDISSASEYKKYIKRKWLVLAGLIILLALAIIVSISVGSSGMGLLEIIKAIFKQASKGSNTIVWNVRMPRVAVGICVGAALAMTACIMQNVLRNQLASSSTLGVSQGASFGAAFSIIVFGAGTQVNAGGISSAISITNPYSVSACAFVGGITTTIIILGLLRLKSVSPSVMVLAGVAISSLFTGATTLLQYFADDVMVASVVYWTFGSLGRAGWREIAIIFVLALFAFIFFMINRWNYNAMESGVNTAKSLGVPVDFIIVGSMVICALISSVSVAFVGCINFIGLIAPHIVRRLVGNDYRFLIPCSAIMGSVLMLSSDIVSRTLVSPTVLPIGALTSFLGAPLFLYMIMKKEDTHG